MPLSLMMWEKLYKKWHHPRCTYIFVWHICLYSRSNWWSRQLWSHVVHSYIKSYVVSFVSSIPGGVPACTLKLKPVIIRIVKGLRLRFSYLVPYIYSLIFRLAIEPLPNGLGPTHQWP